MHVFIPRFITCSMMIPTMIRLIMVCLMVIILAVGGFSDEKLYVCQNNLIQESYAYLHFNTSILSGINGSCSCKIDLEGTTFIKFETDALMFPNCTNDDIAFYVISNKTITFTCDSNNGIKNSPGQDRSMVEQTPVWLVMSRTGDSPPLYGSIYIASTTIGGSLGGPLTMYCYEPNDNIPSIPTTQETSTYSSSTTSTTSTASTAPTTSIKVTADSSTINSTTSTSPAATTSPAAASTTNIPETSSIEIHENSPRSTTSLIMSTSDDKSATSSESLKGNQALAIAGGIGGGIIFLLVGTIACVVFHGRYRINRRTDSNQIPEPRDHPTYCDLTNRENTEYEHIDHDKGPNRNRPIQLRAFRPRPLRREWLKYLRGQVSSSDEPGRVTQHCH